METMAKNYGSGVDDAMSENGPSGSTATMQRRRRPLASSTKFADGAKGDPEAMLQEQLQDDRIVSMRAELGLRFVDDLQIPNYGDMWIPGYRLISEELAKELSLSAMQDDPFNDLPPDQPQPPSGAVDGNLVASFVDGVSGAQKNDVLNSCLLAQLGANAKFDRATDPVNWTRAYSRVLENIAWVVPQYDFRQLHSSQTRFTMDSAIITVISGLLDGSGKAVLSATLDALKSLNDGDRRITIFNRNAVNVNQGNFQFNSVGVSSAGVLSMNFSAYLFRTNEHVTSVLWFSFSGGSTDLKVTRTTTVLNEQVYDQIRDAIVNKLGSRATDYIAGLELSDV